MSTANRAPRRFRCSTLVAVVSACAVLLAACTGTTSDSDESDTSDGDGPDEVDGMTPVEGAFLSVDGEELTVVQVVCSAIGGGPAWRVAAAFGIEPEGRFMFDVRTELDDAGQPVDDEGLNPTVTLQIPYEGDEDPEAFEFLVANSGAVGGDTTALDISTSGSSGSIEVELQQLSTGDEPDSDVTRVVEYDLPCPE